jgi:hypothetical protein
MCIFPNKQIWFRHLCNPVHQMVQWHRSETIFECKNSVLRAYFVIFKINTCCFIQRHIVRFKFLLFWCWMLILHAIYSTEDCCFWSFLKVDIQAIRERVTCQLVINRYNEHQVPLVQKFLAKHVRSIFLPNSNV